CAGAYTFTSLGPFPHGRGHPRPPGPTSLIDGAEAFHSMTAAALPTTPPTELSVVVPVYGCVGCLEELADQVQAAVEGMGVPFEMILVDDASPDGAWRRIQELAATRPWL